MKKSSKAIIVIISCIVLIVAIGVISVITDGTSGSRDEYGTNVTYRDEARKIPIATDINFNITHTKSDQYDVRTDSTGNFQLSYEAMVESGEVFVRIKDGDEVIKEYNVRNKNNVTETLLPDYNYIIEVYIKKGKGSLNLTWMEAIS